jgi:hypothetical protein
VSTIAPVRTGPAVQDLEVFLEIAEYVIRLSEHFVQPLASGHFVRLQEPCDQLPYIYVFFNHFVVILVWVVRDAMSYPADCRVPPVPLFSGPRGWRTAKDALALVWCVICVMSRNQPIVAQKQLPQRPI